MSGDIHRFSTPDSSGGGGGGGATVGVSGVVTGEQPQQTVQVEQINCEELLKELEAVVERLKALFNEDGSLSLTDDTIEVSRLCRCLEMILRHGQKEKLSFWGERKDYYHYLTENSGLKSLDPIVKKVQGLTELVSAQGKGRALIRLCLNDQLLADCVQNSLGNMKKTKDWYQANAVLQTPVQSQRLISALYDLSDVTFHLPVEGLDLDEAWPSFVQKSFSSDNHLSRGGVAGGSGGVSGLLKKALKTRDAKSIDKGTRQDTYTLERAMEEEPSEIFVKHEVPFDINQVGMLLEEIRTLLIDEFEGYSHVSNLPNIRVKELDDISSSLSLLKDYISTMSSDVTRNMDKRKRLIHQLKQQIAKVESDLSQVNEKSSELEEELRMKESDLASSTLQLQVVSEEKRKFWSQVIEQREELSLLREQVAKLQEEKTKSSVEMDSKVHSELWQLQQELSSTQQSLSELNSTHSQLQLQLERESESKIALTQALSSVKETQEREKKEHSLEKISLREDINSLQANLSMLEEKLRTKEGQIEELELTHTDQISELESKLESSVSRREAIEKEKELLKEELKNTNGMIEQETASLRFQLSTTSIQLQQNNETNTKKDLQLTEMKDQLQQLSEQLTQARNTLYQKQETIEELQQQLAISETRSQGLQDDMKSLNEQLTEKTLNRDAVREEYLRQQREWDDQRERKSKEMELLKSHNAKLAEENSHIRRALQKLLAQKVSLWQHADELEQEQVAKGHWLDDRLVTDCMACKTPFTMFNRKHHCRSCGKVFCTPCCSHRVQLPSNRDPVRACKSCHERIQSLRTPQASQLVNESHEEDDPRHSLEPDDAPPYADERSSINNFPGGVSLSTNNSLLLDGSDESLLAHLKEVRPVVSSQPNSVDNSVEYGIQPLSDSTTTALTDNNGAGMQTTLTYAVAGSDTTTADPDDDFCIIETVSSKNEAFPVGLDSLGKSHLDVHALQARLAKLEPAEGEDIERDRSFSAAIGNGGVGPDSVVREVTDLEVGGGVVHHVSVRVTTPRTIVLWQFNSQPKGIAVGLKYQDTTAEDDSLVEVLPLRRVMSHKTILTGEYVSQKAGIYTLVFSNAHSKFSGRVLSYKVWTKSAQ